MDAAVSFLFCTLVITIRFMKTCTNLNFCAAHFDARSAIPYTRNFLKSQSYLGIGSSKMQLQGRWAKYPCPSIRISYNIGIQNMISIGNFLRNALILVMTLKKKGNYKHIHLFVSRWYVKVGFSFGAHQMPPNHNFFLVML